MPTRTACIVEEDTPLMDLLGVAGVKATDVLLLAKRIRDLLYHPYHPAADQAVEPMQQCLSYKTVFVTSVIDVLGEAEKVLQEVGDALELELKEVPLLPPR